MKHAVRQLGGTVMNDTFSVLGLVCKMAHALLCSSCNVLRPRSGFSTSQLRKGPLRRCGDCVSGGGKWFDGFVKGLKRAACDVFFFCGLFARGFAVFYTF